MRRTPLGITRLHPPGPDGSLDGTSRHADSDEGPAGPHSPTALRLKHSTTHHTDAASSAAPTVKNDRVSNATTKRGPADYRTWPDRLCERSSRTAVAKAPCSPRRIVAARRAAASRTRSVKRPRSRSPVRTTSSKLPHLGRRHRPSAHHPLVDLRSWIQHPAQHQHRPYATQRLTGPHQSQQADHRDYTRALHRRVTRLQPKCLQIEIC